MALAYSIGKAPKSKRLSLTLLVGFDYELKKTNPAAPGQYEVSMKNKKNEPKWT